MIEICAITTEPPPRLAESLKLKAVRSAGLVALCTSAQDEELSADVLWSREEMLETLMEQCDLLPVRYGTRADDDDAVVQVLAERRPQLADALERTRGAVELAVRVVQAAARAAAPEPPASGADYLRSKARHDAAADDIHSPLASLARASRQHPGRAPGELMRAAYLVDRDAVSSFVDRVAELQKAKPELRLLCTGPWPPYSFTSA